MRIFNRLICHHKIPIAVITLVSFPVFTGCNNIRFTDVKFDKTQWNEVGDLQSHTNREDMLNDLIEHHKIKGLTYHQLIDSLGQPANYEDTTDSIYYDIVVNYGYLDPKSGKYLAIGFNKDSIVTGFKVVEWKNRHANE
jgi:hypothetical protein